MSRVDSPAGRGAGGGRCGRVSVTRRPLGDELLIRLNRPPHCGPPLLSHSHLSPSTQLTGAWRIDRNTCALTHTRPEFHVPWPDLPPPPTSLIYSLFNEKIKEIQWANTLVNNAHYGVFIIPWFVPDGVQLTGVDAFCAPRVSRSNILHLSGM